MCHSSNTQITSKTHSLSTPLSANHWIILRGGGWGGFYNSHPSMKQIRIIKINFKLYLRNFAVNLTSHIFIQIMYNKVCINTYQVFVIIKLLIRETYQPPVSMSYSFYFQVRSALKTRFTTAITCMPCGLMNFKQVKNISPTPRFFN